MSDYFLLPVAFNALGVNIIFFGGKWRGREIIKVWSVELLQLKEYQVC